MGEFKVGDKIVIDDNYELAMTGVGTVVEVWNTLDDISDEEIRAWYVDVPEYNDFPTIVYIIDDDSKGTTWFGSADYISNIEEDN